MPKGIGETTMPKRTTDYRTTLLEDLKDPREATNYLNAALQESEEMFLMALRDVAEARQMATVAKNAGVSRESLYRMLGASGNPTYRNLLGILKALGIEFAEVRSRSHTRMSTPRLSRSRLSEKRISAKDGKGTPRT